LKKSEDESVKADLTAGISSAERVLQKANEAVDRDLLDEALEDLIGRVEDWKSHRVEQFGKLLLHGVYTVVTGKSDQEKDVRDTCSLLILCFLILTRLSSMRSISLNAYCSAARRSLPIRARTRKTRPSLQVPRSGTVMQSYSLRVVSS
jgi:cell division control protein 24